MKYARQKIKSVEAKNMLANNALVNVEAN